MLFRSDYPTLEAAQAAARNLANGCGWIILAIFKRKKCPKGEGFPWRVVFSSKCEAAAVREAAAAILGRPAPKV